MERKEECSWYYLATRWINLHNVSIVTLARWA
jgi:hypothetical protein